MEKTNKKVLILAIAAAVIAAAMIICTKFIVPPCAGMLELANGKQMYMKCHYTAVVILFLGVLFVVNAFIYLLTKEAMACGIMGGVLSICVFLLLNDSIGIGICMKTDMACHTTAAFAKVFASVELIVCLVISALASWKAKKK